MKAVISMLLLAALISSCEADKTTIDPNASGQTRVYSASTSDERLNALVTYQEGYGRLHKITDDLTRITGVRIRAGQNEKNWKVRDIPLIVCVKEMPLGRLLKLIAAATHLELAAERIADPNALPVYRFYRKEKDQQAIDSDEDPAIEANNQIAAWAWDTLVEYSKMPERELVIVPGKWDGKEINQIDSSFIRIVSELLASFGREVKNKVLSGEQVDIAYSTSPHKELLRRLYSYICANPKSGVFRVGPEGAKYIEWDESDLDKCFVSFKKRPRNGSCENAGLEFSVSGISTEIEFEGQKHRTTENWEGNMIKMARSVAATKELNMTPAPDFTEVFEKKDKFPEDGYRTLNLDKDLKSDPLNKEYTIKVDSGKRYATFGDAFASFARQLDLNVVAEDFMSHKCVDSSWTLIHPNLKISVGMALRRLRRISSDPVWFIEAEGKTLVGWAGEWRDKHKNLVEEALIENLKKKMETTGAELDDMMPLLGLSEDQYSDWFHGTEYFQGPIDFLPPTDYISWWALYGILPAEERALARSEAGLAMGRFETSWLSGFLSNKLKDEEKYLRRSPDPTRSENPDSPTLIFADPNRLRGITIRIVQVPMDTYDVVRYGDNGRIEQTRGSTLGSRNPKKHCYEIRLAEKTPEGIHEIKCQWNNIAFPLFTPDKEVEMIKKASGK